MIKKIFKYLFAVSLVLMSLSGLFIASKHLPFGSVKSTKAVLTKSSVAPLPYDSIGNTTKSIAAGMDASPPKDKYTVDLGGTESRENAERILESLAQKGIQGFYTPFQKQNGSLAFRVRVGLFPSEEEAAQKAKTISSTTEFTGKIIKI